MSTSRGKRPQPPGIAKSDDVAAMIRVDHAGEYGAVRIYEGQLAVLSTRPGAKKTAQAIAKMARQEQDHLKAFDALINQRRVRPTALAPVWHLAGFALGAATALMGEKAAMACTAAVEDVIDEHYAGQIACIESDDDLKARIVAFRADEIAHRDEALARGAEDAPGYRLLYGRDQVRLSFGDQALRTDMSATDERYARLKSASNPRRATDADIGLLARLFTAAFANDPVFDWIARSGPKRAQGLERFFFWVLKARAVPFGDVWLADDGSAAAAWLPPGVAASPGGFFEQLMLLPIFIRLCGIPRLARGSAMADAMEKHHPTKSHYYLSFVAVAPRLQGMGLGSAILEATLKQADANGWPAYLENSNPKNTRLYERHGFVARPSIAPKGAPPLLPMWRDPK